MSIITSATERAAWMASARLCWLELEDLRLEVAVAAPFTSPAIPLLNEIDQHLARAQREIDRAIDKVKGLTP